jgi:hypothetical protein
MFNKSIESRENEKVVQRKAEKRGRAESNRESNE